MVDASVSVETTPRAPHSVDVVLSPGGGQPARSLALLRRGRGPVGVAASPTPGLGTRAASVCARLGAALVSAHTLPPGVLRLRPPPPRLYWSPPRMRLGREQSRVTFPFGKEPTGAENFCCSAAFFFFSLVINVCF